MVGRQALSESMGALGSVGRRRGWHFAPRVYRNSRWIAQLAEAFTHAQLPADATRISAH